MVCLGTLLSVSALPSSADVHTVREADILTVREVTAAPSPTATTSGAGADVDDVHTVYCLAKERRKAVVEAAVRLGLAKEVEGKPERLVPPPWESASKAGNGQTVEKWAEGSREPFRRVCDAVMQADANASAAPEPGASGPSTLEALAAGALLAVLGSALTLMGGATERSAARRRAQADELDGATIRFALAAEGYLSVWVGERDAAYGELGATRDELSVALRRFGVAGARRGEARDLADSLPFDGPLPDSTPGGPQGNRYLDEREKQTEADRQRTLLEGALSSVDRLASTSPLRRAVRKLRRDVPRGGRT